MSNIQKPHVAAVPFPALGHSIPFLDLARLLASFAVTVSYVTTPANVSRVQKPIQEAVASGLDIRLVVLRAPVVEGLPEGRESTDLIPNTSNRLIFQFTNKLREPFNTWIEGQLQADEESRGGTPPPVCVIHDLFIGWAQETADKYKIESILFNTCGAFAINLLQSVSDSILQNRLRKEGDSVVLSSNLPRPLRFYKHEIAASFFEPDFSSPVQLFVFERHRSISKSSGMLVNTFDELEPVHLQKIKALTGKPVWAIGPVLAANFFEGGRNVSARGKMSDIGEDDLVRWLDSQRLGSVVYVSFGSQTFLSEQQMEAIARGLEASDQPFVWAIKVAPSVSTTEATDPSSRFLPEGFQERTKDKGLVIWGWAPQLVILSHPSVGAFMSHCGWNSTLESITLGVPLIAWPMFGDQHFNSKLVGDLGVGIQFCEHRDGLPTEERVNEAVTMVLATEKGKEMKKSTEKLKEMAREAIQHKGSSKTHLEAFVAYVYELNIGRYP